MGNLLDSEVSLSPPIRLSEVPLLNGDDPDHAKLGLMSPNGIRLQMRVGPDSKWVPA